MAVVAAEASTRRWCQGGRGPTQLAGGPGLPRSPLLAHAKKGHGCRGPGTPAVWHTKHPQWGVWPGVGAGAGAGVGAGAGAGVGVGV